MSYHGDIRLGDTIDIKFVTTAAATGAPTTLSGSPVVSAYYDNNVTQITSGVTLTVDFDGVTGLNNVRVAATGGNGFAAATNVELVITTGTVGGTSAVGYVVGSFSIENRSALMPSTAARKLVVDANGLADANMVKLGPTGAGTAQTARDIGASVLLSPGTGTGQLDFTSGVVKANSTQLGGAPFYTGTFQAGSSANTAVLQASTPDSQCRPGDIIQQTSGSTAGQQIEVASTSGMGGASPTATALSGQTWTPPAAGVTYTIFKKGGTVSSTASDFWSATSRTLSADGIQAIFNAAFAESYATVGTPPTMAQAMLTMIQMMSNATTSGTTMTVYKLNGTDVALTLQLNNAFPASLPTSIARDT